MGMDLHWGDVLEDGTRIERDVEKDTNNYCYLNGFTKALNEILYRDPDLYKEKIYTWEYIYSQRYHIAYEFADYYSPDERWKDRWNEDLHNCLELFENLNKQLKPEHKLYVFCW